MKNGCHPVAAPTQAPASIAELSDCLESAHAAGQAVVPIGCGTKWHLGRAPQRCDLLLSTRGLRRIVAHEAADMTVTVEAGITLAELNTALAAAGQHLPIDPPLPESTTIGSAIATDASGPLRLSQGKIRDLLIGITAVLANGTVIKGGGRVVKNVAGYDLMKLFAGSYGTLAVVAEATFKLRPLPEVRVDFVAQQSTLAAALELGSRVLDGSITPLYVIGLNAGAAARLGLDAATVIVGCGGSVAEIDAQRLRLAALTGSRELADGAARSLYIATRDLPSTALGVGCLGAKLSVLGSRLPALLTEIEAYADAQAMPISAIAHVGVGTALIRCPAPSPALAGHIVAHTRAAGGWVMFDAIPAALQGKVDPWPMLPPGLELMRGIKRSLDPHNLLSPGRFVGGI